MKKFISCILLIAIIFIPGVVSANSKTNLFWDKDAGNIEARFECAKNSEPELIAFIRQMPKGADLHNHLSGATYSDYLLDSAEKNGLNYDLGTNLFYSPNNSNYKPISPITITLLESNPVYLAQYLNIYSMRGWYPNTTNGHDQFFNTFNYMGSANRTSDDMLLEVINRNIYENVKYLELMTNSLPNNYTNLFTNTAQNFDINKLDDAYNQAMEVINNNQSVVNTSIKNLLDAREKMLADSGVSIGSGKDIEVNYIQQLYRSTNDMRNFFITAFYSAYATKVDKRIVGVNMVQAEDTPYSRKYFDDEMKIMDYIWNRMDKPSFTLHAGELELTGSPVEPMENRISTTIEKGHALRIGHGVSVAWEKNLPKLLKEMKEKNILVEICLSSNESILGVENEEHPFTMYRKAGVKTALSTDDEGVSRGNLTEEYVKAIQRYGLSYKDVKELSRNSLEYSFLPGQSLYINGDYTKVRKEFGNVWSANYKISAKAQKLLDENPKMEREFMLERAYVTFENKLLSGTFGD